jgi:hypothetical protein
MRCAVIVDSDASILGGGPALEGDAPLRAQLETLGFDTFCSLDEVTPSDTVLVHARGLLGDGVWLRELAARLASRKPESALVIA